MTVREGGREGGTERQTDGKRIPFKFLLSVLNPIPRPATSQLRWCHVGDTLQFTNDAGLTVEKRLLHSIVHNAHFIYLGSGGGDASMRSLRPSFSVLSLVGILGSPLRVTPLGILEKCHRIQ